MFNDKFNKPFVDFLNRHFDPSEHLVLCKRWFAEHPFPTGPNVVEISSLDKLHFGWPKKILCHSLFDPEVVEFLYSHPEFLQKSSWMIWGGDLYNAKRDAKNDFVRQHIRQYITDTDGDDTVAAKKYHSSAELTRAGYTFPVTKDMIDAAMRKKVPHNFIRIQINNSADCSTVAMLKTVSKFADKRIRVSTILSYGDLRYRNEIIREGKALFADRFEPVLEYMTPNKYAEWMSNVDILVLNQDRQQGLGNSFVAIAEGVKVFVRSDVTTFEHYKSRGMTCSDSLLISQMTFSEFIAYPSEERERNRLKVKEFFDNQNLAALWRHALEV